MDDTNVIIKDELETIDIKLETDTPGISLPNNETLNKHIENDSCSPRAEKDIIQNMDVEGASSKLQIKDSTYELNTESNSNVLMSQESIVTQIDNKECIAKVIDSITTKSQGSNSPMLNEGIPNNTNDKGDLLNGMQITTASSDAYCKSTTDHPTFQQLRNTNKMSSLTAIAAEYECSDSDNSKSDLEDNVNLSTNPQSNVHKSTETNTEESKNIYRTKEVVAISSEESDSESDSSSSISSSNSSESLAKGDDDDSDDEVENNSINRNTRNSRSAKESKSELDCLPPIEELKISVPEVLCDPFGEVAWTVEQLVVVRPKPGKPTLNLDTVLFVERGQRALGKIFDVFGQVSEPHYCIRFNSSEHIQQSNIKVGMLVYYCPNSEYTSLVFLQELAKMRGTDEGGARDDEPPDFSDDEEERRYYESLKKKNTKPKNHGNEGVPHKRPRTSSPTGWKSNHPWNRTARFYSRRQPGSNTNVNTWQGNPMQNPYNAHGQWQGQPMGYPHQNNLWMQPMHTNVLMNPNNQYEYPYFHPIPPTQSAAYNGNARYRFDHPYQHMQLASPQNSYTTSTLPQSQAVSGPRPSWFPLPPPPPPPPSE